MSAGEKTEEYSTTKITKFTKKGRGFLPFLRAVSLKFISPGCSPGKTMNSTFLRAVSLILKGESTAEGHGGHGGGRGKREE